MMLPQVGPAALLLLAAVRCAEAGSLASLPFSWDTLPRYTFCVNSSDPKTLTDGLFNEEALEYISKQPIYLNNPSLTRPAGAVTMEEERQPRQAQALLKKNPKQRQWFYYAIDLVRGHAFANDNWVEHHPECQLHDKNGQPVERTVWDFGSECGTERWLNTSRAMIAGGLNGIFLDGFQGCDPFTKGGWTRVCTSKAGCDPAVLERWNAGLRAAMWRLKRSILGENGTFICNSTPGPYACAGNTSTPVEDCPCDGTNDERGGGSFDHEEIVDQIDKTDGVYAMLTHVPHGNDKAVFLKSVPKFLMAASKYQYLGSGFGYECSSGGWLTTDPDVEHAFSAPLGPPVGPANATPGCKPKPTCCKRKPSCSPECSMPGSPCVRTRVFASGTKAFVNYSGGQTCMIWSDGKNTSTPSQTHGRGQKPVDGCASAASWPF